MKTLEVCLIDENEVQLGTYAAALNALLEKTGVAVIPMAPLPTKEDYVPLLATGTVAGLIIDQKLEDGGFNYTGSELASFLRGIDSKLPIIILTNYKDEEYEQFEAAEKDIEYVAAKDAIGDLDSREAQVFKARLLRHLNVFADVHDERQRRFHELLVKSLRETLSSEETTELGLLKTDRLLSVQADEQRETPTLESLLEDLRKRVSEEERPK